MEGKAKLSEKVLGLRFMQRAIDKQKQAEADKPPEEKNDEHWIATRHEGSKGCVVVLEGDPPATTGMRMSFQGFHTGPKTAYGFREDASGGANEGQEASVDDEAMAARLGKKDKTEEQRRQKTEKKQSGKNKRKDEAAGDKPKKKRKKDKKTE